MVHENLPPRDDRTLWLFAVGVGLTPLIPLPWLDGVTGVWLRRRLVRQLAARRGVALVEEQVRVLTDPPPSTCLGGLGMLLLWPVKKVFRTTFFVLLVNEMFELTVETFHRSWLIDAALHGLDPLDVGHVRAALDRTCAAVELRPARRWWRGDRSGIVVDAALRHFAEELVRPAPKINVQ